MLFVTDEEGGGGVGDDDGKRQTCAALTQAQPVRIVSHGYMGSGMVVIPGLRPDGEPGLQGHTGLQGRTSRLQLN